MRNILLATITTLLLFNSCRKEDDLLPNNSVDIATDSLIADFSYEIIVKENEPDVYVFNNKSKNATSFKWYFGNFDSSTVTNPSITFPTQNFHTVILYANNGKGTKMKAYRIDVKDLNPGDEPSLNILDFKVNINCDSQNLYKCVNLSNGFSDFKWTFSDGTESTEINPEHLFLNTGTSQRTITLNAKDVNGNPKSISRTFNTGYATFKIENCAVILVNQNPIRYRFYEAQSTYQDLEVDFITYFNGNTIDTIQYNDNANTELELAVYQGANTFKFHNVNSNYLTVYKIVKTPSINNIIDKINRINGLVDFQERYKLEEVSYTPPRRTDYNDTTLNINLNNSLNVRIVDSTLNHSFSGYPAFWNYTVLSDSNIVNFIDYNYNISHPFINHSKKIKFNIITNDINASYYYYQGGKVSVTTQLIYNGRLR